MGVKTAPEEKGKWLYHAQKKQEYFHLSTADEVLYGGAAGGGKVARLEAPILTPFGFKLLKYLKVGDLINNPDGSIQRIIKLRPVFDLDCWIVEFTDGTKTEVAEDHLWKAWKGRKGRKIKNVRTFGEESAEIVETQEMLSWIKRGYTPQIPVCKEQSFNQTTKYKKLNPYLLGVLLGDGCIRTDYVRISCDEKDKEHYCNIFGNDEINYAVNQDISFLGEKRKEIVKKLKNYKLLGTGSLTKFIPTFYKYASIRDRYALIQGLMDTDGYNDKKDNGCYYYTISPKLANDVAFILRSLGAVVTITKDKASYKKNGKIVMCNDCYNLYIKHPKKDLLFSMKRKKTEKDSINISKSVNKIYIDGKITGKCITVSNPNGLYITDDFIVTHNSAAILWDAIIKCLSYDNLRVAIFRRTYPELEKSLIYEFLSKVPNNLYTYNKQDKRAIFTKTKSVIEFNHCQFEQDIFRFQSAEYAFIYIDELTHWTEWLYTYLLSRLRSTRTDIKCQMKSASNPGGVGHEFVRRRFIDGAIPLQITDRYEKESGARYTTEFIPAKVYDNEYLMRTEYVKNLMKLPLDDRKALLEGDWDSFKGQFFKEWKRSLHVITPFAIPPNWKRFRSIDWGYRSPSAVLWYAVSPDKKVYVYKELYVAEKTDEELAYLITDMSKNETISYTVADPSLWSTNQYERGESIAMRLAKFGIACMKADNNRIAGASAVHSLLAIDTSDKKPTLMFFENCFNCARSIPALVYDQSKPEDVDNSGDDHCFDSLKYGVLSHPIPNITYKPKAPARSFDWVMEEFKHEKEEGDYIGHL